MRGFTFLEVILALTLFSFGLLAVTGMFGISTQALQSGGDRTKAVLLAQEKLEQLKILPYHSLIFPPAGEYPDGPFDTVRENHGPIHLTWSVQKDQPWVGLSVLTVEATWRISGGQIKSVKFTTLRADLGDNPASGTDDSERE
jgi:prepilin-type N-terminal cleavage/methylation domain-containing protein